VQIPPVNVSAGYISPKIDDYYLVVSRLAGPAVEFLGKLDENSLREDYATVEYPSSSARKTSESCR
jgi:hypothetical protein